MEGFVWDPLFGGGWTPKGLGWRCKKCGSEKNIKKGKTKRKEGMMKIGKLNVRHVCFQSDLVGSSEFTTDMNLTIQKASRWRMLAVFQMESSSHFSQPETLLQLAQVCRHTRCQPLNINTWNSSIISKGPGRPSPNPSVGLFRLSGLSEMRKSLKNTLG